MFAVCTVEFIASFGASFSGEILLLCLIKSTPPAKPDLALEMFAEGFEAVEVLPRWERFGWFDQFQDRIILCVYHQQRIPRGDDGLSANLYSLLLLKWHQKSIWVEHLKQFSGRQLIFFIIPMTVFRYSVMFACVFFVCSLFIRSHLGS